MKRTLAVLLAVLMIFGCAALTACNKTGLVNDRDDAQIISADEIADTMTSKDGKYEIAMVTNVGRLKDKSFNQGTWDGVKTFAYQNGKSYKYYQLNIISRETAIRPRMTTDTMLSLRL